MMMFFAQSYMHKHPLCGHCAPVLRGFPANRAAPAACALGDLHSKIPRGIARYFASGWIPVTSCSAGACVSSGWLRSRGSCSRGSSGVCRRRRAARGRGGGRHFAARSPARRRAVPPAGQAATTGAAAPALPDSSALAPAAALALAPAAVPTLALAAVPAAVQLPARFPARPGALFPRPGALLPCGGRG